MTPELAHLIPYLALGLGFVCAFLAMLMEDKNDRSQRKRRDPKAGFATGESGEDEAKDKTVDDLRKQGLI